MPQDPHPAAPKQRPEQHWLFRLHRPPSGWHISPTVVGVVVEVTVVVGGMLLLGTVVVVVVTDT